MNKKLVFVLILITLFSGCVEEKTVKIGDNISVDYTGSLLNGKVFDTSNENVAKENNISNRGSEYKPIKFTVGKGQMVKGFDEGVIGMKVGETRKLTIPPEKAYGQSNPQMIQAIPILQEIPATRILPKNFEVPVRQFESLLGPDHKKGEIVMIPETNINLTILNISSDNSSNVSLSYNLMMGDEIWTQGATWNETVVKIDDKNITLRANVNKNDIVQLQGAPWNTTVVGLNNVNITLRHNPIQETVIPGRFGQMKVRFNETSIILDQNPELAGQTLIFNVTILSIDVSEETSKITTMSTVVPTTVVQTTVVVVPTTVILTTVVQTVQKTSSATPTVSKSVTRLNSGTVFKRTLGTGNGRLEVNNKVSSDTIVSISLTSREKESLLKAYIRAGDTVTISDMPDGKFTLFYMSGKDWNSTIDRFNVIDEMSKFDDPLTYDIFANYWNVTLYPVEGGNAQTTGVSEYEFPK